MHSNNIFYPTSGLIGYADFKNLIGLWIGPTGHEVEPVKPSNRDTFSKGFH